MLRTIFETILKKLFSEIIVFYFCQRQFFQLCLKYASEQVLVGIWCLKYQKLFKTLITSRFQGMYVLLCTQNRHLNSNSTHCACLVVPSAWTLSVSLAWFKNQHDSTCCWWKDTSFKKKENGSISGRLRLDCSLYTMWWNSFQTQYHLISVNSLRCLRV